MTSTHQSPTSTHAATTPVSDALNSAEGMAKHAAHSAADHANQSLQALVQEVSPTLNSLADRVSQFSRQGVAAMHSGQHQVGKQLTHAKDSTISYIQHEPVKSVLMAAAIGASLVTVFNLLTRSKH